MKYFKDLIISISAHLIQFECIFLDPTSKLNMPIKEICNISYTIRPTKSKVDQFLHILVGLFV